MSLPAGLLLITDRQAARHPLTEIAATALDAGFTAVMLREKDLPGAELLALADALAAVCATRGAPLLINDRLDVALCVPGAGAHMGAAGLPVAAARALLGPERLLGYSAHDAAEAAGALEEGADYVTWSPVFGTVSKPGLQGRGLDVLADVLRAVPAERVRALGGLLPSNLAAVAATGVGGAAVMGAVMRSGNPAETAAACVTAWREGA